MDTMAEIEDIFKRLLQQLKKTPKCMEDVVNTAKNEVIRTIHQKNESIFDDLLQNMKVITHE